MTLHEAYDRLWNAYGPQGWWPGETTIEIVVGTILTQNTSWKNVERAIENLRDVGLLDSQRLHTIDIDELAEIIRPAGYYRLKARRLKNLLQLVHTQYSGQWQELFSLDTNSLRETLLSVNGIGPETADSIALYAANKPTFVIDAYTARVLKRHGWIDFEAGYVEMQELFHDQLEQNVLLFNEYHALIVRVGKEHCGTQPKCNGCPLQELLPESGVQTA
ncbi:MAG: endonuclease III domain-containing protein [Pirellulaceae bacterium]|nr:endonuclease III domain-containing protein [Planctomycetales bacterium]